MPKHGRMPTPARRVLALDAGSRCLKLLLAQNDFGRLRILKEELIDLRAEGLVAADEIKSHLQATIKTLGHPPLALILPQHVSLSQVVDLPIAPDDEVEKLIENETLKLSGVSESRIVYDFVRTEAASKNRQQFWVTLCQEGEIRERLLRLGIEQEDISEVTTTANALMAAYRAACPLSSRAIIVHLGAQSTVVVVLLAGQAAFAASFDMGADFFTRALARSRGGGEASAEELRRTQDLLNGPDAEPKFISVVDGWVAELKRQLQDWFTHNSGVAADPASFDLVASGGGFDQPGLLEYLKSSSGLGLRPWPKVGQAEGVSPSKRFEVAFGAALQALGLSAQPVSLLPDDYRASWRKRQLRQRLEVFSYAMLAVCAIALLIATWRQATLINRKQALLSKVNAAQDSVEANQKLTAELLDEYERFRPVFAGQQSSLDTVRTLSVLQQVRSNRSFWFVLLADQASYFSPAASGPMTNKPLRACFIPSSGDRPRTLPPDFITSILQLTNSSPAKPGFIAELSVPDNAEGSRKLLSDLVSELQNHSLFARVDLLSEDQHRKLADPKVSVSDRRYVLSLDFAETQFQPGALARRILPVGPQRPPAQKRSPRSTRGTSETDDSANPSTP